MATTHVRQSWNHLISSPNSFSYHTSDSCVSKSFIQSAKGTIFHFQSVVFSRLERTAVKVTLDCVLLLHTHQARAAVMTNACYWCVHVCVGCVQSQWRPAHTCVRVQQVYHLCCKSKDCYEYIISRLPWGLSSGWVSRKQAPLFKKNEQLLVCLGGTNLWGRRGMLWKGSEDFSDVCEDRGRRLIDCWKCINAGVPIKPGKVSLWNTIPLILFCWLDGRLEEVKISKRKKTLSFLVQFCPS